MDSMRAHIPIGHVSSTRTFLVKMIPPDTVRDPSEFEDETSGWTRVDA
jgi:hypothetical protein